LKRTVFAAQSMFGNQPQGILMNERLNRSGLFGQNISAPRKSFAKSPITCGNPAKMSARHALAALAFESQIGVDRFKQIMWHEPHDARLCVHVNNCKRFIVRATHGKQLYKSGMTATSFDRIAAAILLSGKSFRSISESAKLGVNYVSQMFIKQNPPKNETLAALCEVLDIDAGWVLTGNPSNPRIDSLLTLLAELPFETKRSTIEVVAKGDSVKFEELNRSARETGIPVETLRAWISDTGSEYAGSDSAAAFDELTRIANGQELDFELLREALAEAYEIEHAILGRLGPPETRAKLVKEIYSLKRSRVPASENPD